MIPNGSIVTKQTYGTYMKTWNTIIKNVSSHLHCCIYSILHTGGGNLSDINMYGCVSACNSVDKVLSEVLSHKNVIS